MAIYWEWMPIAVLAYAGWRLPTTPKFKGDLQARQEYPVDGRNQSICRPRYRAKPMPSRTSVSSWTTAKLTRQVSASVDMSIGLKRNTWRAELFVHNLFDSRGEAGGRAQSATRLCARAFTWYR